MQLLCSVSSSSELERFISIEESLPENTPVCVSLVFNTTELDDLCGQINQKCADIGVTRYYEQYAYHVYNRIDIYWVKGLSFWGLILAAIIPLIAVPLISAAIYALLPESWKQVIDAVMWFSILGVVMYLFGRISHGLTRS